MSECENHEWIEYTLVDEYGQPYYQGHRCALCGTEGYAA